MSDNKDAANLLIKIGSIVALIEAILHFLGYYWFGWIGAIVLLILSVIVIMSVFQDKVFDWDNGSLIVGILLIIAAVLLLVD